ncbi:hypothetical protein EDB86DRAFT_900775 [Lactarius hatsudake]|nr:hypothetical protein EDB86DRAFT_900775 [Lactarius hatsudake]
MLAVLCSSPRPPFGVALLGFTIVILSWMLHLLPYIMFCGMITLSVWPPSHPLPPDVTYYPVNGLPNQVHMVHTRVDSQPSKKARSFELIAELRILVFLLAVPVTSVVENAFFRPVRSIFLRTVECWFDMRYVHPSQISGSWPDTWTPIFNVLRSCEFVADFIDSATGRDSGPSLPTRGSHSIAQPAEQREISRQCKRASNPDPTVHSKLEGATDAHRSRKTFVSPPHVSPQSPWKANGLGGFSPVSKNLSRIVGILFHHPPPPKPVIRCQTNLMAKFPSARVQPHVLERLWSRHEDNVALAWASMSSLGVTRNSQTHWHDGAQLLHSTWDHVSNYVTAIPELGEHIAEGSFPPSMVSRFLPGTCEALTIEQTQFEQQQCWGYGRSPLTSLPLSEPPVQTLPPNFVSDWQEKQYIRPRSMQTPVHHGSPYQDQHITTPPVYRQQELDHRSFQGFPSGLDSITLVQHGSHVYSDTPDWPMADQEPIFEQRAALATVMESPLPPFSSLPIGSQEKFTFQSLDNLPLFEFSEDAPLLDHSPPSTSPPRVETSEIARTSDGYATTTLFVPCTTSQDEFSHPSSRPMPIDAPPEAASSDYHSRSPTITSPVIQPRHIAQPFFGLRVSGTFTFDVSRVIPYFDFSHHLSPPPPVGVELDVIPPGTTAMSFPSNPRDMNGAWPPARQLSFDQGVQIQQAPRDTASLPQEVVSNPLPHQPFPPAGQGNSATGDTATPSTTGAKMSVDGDDGDDSSSGSDSSDSSDTDSDTDMDSDSDSSSSGDDSDSDSDDSSEDENDAVATETVCKTSSRPPDASFKAQDNVQGVPTNRDKGADSDSDDDEYTPTLAPAPGASNNDDSSSSDEDMSDHEEEDRLYWEKFYTPRHRRQPDVSGSV